MGLDIYHFKAKLGEGPTYIERDDITEALFEEFKIYKATRLIEKLNWHEIFKRTQLEYKDFEVAKTSTYKTQDGIFYDFYFRRKSTLLSIFLKSPVIFTENPKFSPTAADFAGLAIWERKPKVIFGPLKQKTYDIDVIYFDEAGYQRNSVEERFFREFPPDAIIRNIESVRRIFELTQIKAQDRFRRKFIENWDPDRSFVQISW